MSKCGIYMIKNKINGFAYIGQAKDIDRRWDRHKYDALHNVDTYLYRSIRKYGISNFEFSIVELCDVEELDAKEIFYIKKYNTCICNGGNGYNLTTGGDKVEPKKHPIFCLTNGVAYNSITEASEVLNIPSYTIRAYCKTNKINKYKSKQLRIDNHANGRERKYLDDFCYIEDCGDILEGKGAGRPRKAVIAVPSMKIYSSKNYLRTNDIVDYRNVLTFEKFANKLSNKKYWRKERYVSLEDFLKIFPSTDIDFIAYVERNFN